MNVFSLLVALFSGPTRPVPPVNEAIPPTTNERASPPKEEPKQPATTIPQLKPPVTPAVVTPEPTATTRKSNNIISDSADPAQLLSLKNKITDQEEQIQTLIKKRRDDLEKLKELERTKLQLDQVILSSFSSNPSIFPSPVTILQT